MNNFGCPKANEEGKATSQFFWKAKHHMVSTYPKKKKKEKKERKKEKGSTLWFRNELQEV